jgi:ABC-type Zn uptake system ZnuABC Zn-binding protein ZnuA
MKLRYLLIVILMIFVAGPSYAREVKVVTSTPDLKDMVENICGGDVVVESLMRGPENHHAVPLKPSFLVKLSRCDVLVVNGLEYEHAFVPGALLAINKPNIQRGASHYIDTSKYIKPCEVPSKIDLGLGDLHPLGGSHIHIDPGNGILMCKAFFEHMSRLYPKYAEKWRPRYEDYVKQIYAQIEELRAYVKGTEGLKIVFYHPGWSYLTNRFGWIKTSYVEQRAGIPPTPSHINHLINIMKGQNCRLMAIEVCYSLKIPRYVAKRVGNVRVIQIPHHAKALPGCDTYLKFIDELVKRIAGAGREIMQNESGYPGRKEGE